MTWLLLGLLLAAAGDDVRLRWQGRSRSRRQLTQVDGVELPAPDDPRWENTEAKFVGMQTATAVMRLGHIYVDSAGWTYIRRDKGDASPLPGSTSYGLEVWRSYNNRRSLDSLIDTN